MRRSSLIGILSGTLILVSLAVARDENPLKRDEVSAVKKKLVASLEALGQAPADYAVKDEDFNLPTSANQGRTSGKFSPIYGSATRQYTTDVGREKANKDFSKEYQQKMLDAQAKGDYQAMGALGQEMQKKSAEMQKKATEKQKDPIRVEVRLNANPGSTIDPDAILMEKSGVLALRTNVDKENGKSHVLLVCAPVELKETGTLSRLDLKTANEEYSSRIAVVNIAVEIDGPTAEVESWVKKIDTSKILAQISR